VNKWLLLPALGAAAIGAVILYRVPPVEGSFYPVCAFHALTGLHCPGCGATRSLHALLHGQLRQAAAYNLLLLLVFPFLLIHGGKVAYASFSGRMMNFRPMPTWAIRGLLIILVVFWILRNIPLHPFDLLAPHQLAASDP
jgi:hypothetical protein